MTEVIGTISQINVIGAITQLEDVEGTVSQTLITAEIARKVIIAGPAFVSAEIGDVAENKLVITFNAALNESIIPATTAFSVSGVTGSPSISSVSISGAEATLTLSGNADFADTITVSYAVPDNNPLQDADGMPTPAFTEEAVTNNIVGYCAEFQAVYDSWTAKPSDAVAANMNTLVEADVADGLWAKYDARYITAVHTNANGEAQTNWKNPGTYDLTLVNAPAFVAFEGFTGDGSSYTDTNFNPFSDGVNYTQDDAGFGGYLRKDVAEMSYMMGIEDATKDCYILPRYTSGFAYAKINTNIQTAGGINADSRGMYFANRDAANNQDLWKNKVKIVDDNDASSGVPNFTFYLLAWNNGNVAQNFSTNQIAEARISSSFSDAEIANCTDNFETYMDSNNKGVIT